MKPAFRKNVSYVMADIKHPAGSTAKSSPKSRRPSPEQTPRWLLSLVVSAAILVLGFLVFDIGESATSIYRSFSNLVGSLREIGQPSFYDSLNAINKELGELDRRARFLGLTPQLKEVPAIISDLKEIVDIAGRLGGAFNQLIGEGLTMAFGGRGEELLALLKGLRSDLTRLNQLGVSLNERAEQLGVYREELDLFSGRLSEAVDVLDVLLAYLDQPEAKRLVLLFENYSEIRPSGGFAGSYGDLIIEKGNIKNLQVNDIYYPDRFLSLKVVPPLQLQSITPNFGARDTNWFFDFADSSRNLLDYLEASSIYQKDGVKFAGVISLNVRVVEDILRLTGPVEIPEYNLRLDAQNFLREIQMEVEGDRQPGENPKRVLQFAAPALLNSLGKVESDAKQRLLEMFVARTLNKDIKFYFRDDSMETLVSERGIAGRVYEFGDGFVGDYLAVVNANVAGGKTDAFISQRIVLRSQVNAEGLVENQLLVTRKHRGGSEPESFYNQTNQNFIKVFSVPGAELVSLQGGDHKEIRPLVSYLGGGFSVDSDIQAVEETREVLTPSAGSYAESYLELGRRVFATWFNLEPGDERTLELRYAGQTIPLQSGQRYTFVLDKQSGSETELEYILASPAGFYWRESGSDLFRYQADSIPARLEIELTLIKK